MRPQLSLTLRRAVGASEVPRPMSGRSSAGSSRVFGSGSRKPYWSRRLNSRVCLRKPGASSGCRVVRHGERKTDRIRTISTRAQRRRGRGLQANSRLARRYPKPDPQVACAQGAHRRRMRRAALLIPDGLINGSIAGPADGPSARPSRAASARSSPALVRAEPGSGSRGRDPFGFNCLAQLG